MKRYREKQQIVEAQQWNVGDAPFGGMEAQQSTNSAENEPYAIETPLGFERVHDGNWLVVNEYGQPALFDDVEFEAEFEPVD